MPKREARISSGIVKVEVDAGVGVGSGVGVGVSVDGAGAGTGVGADSGLGVVVGGRLGMDVPAGCLIQLDSRSIAINTPMIGREIFMPLKSKAVTEQYSTPQPCPLLLLQRKRPFTMKQQAMVLGSDSCLSVGSNLQGHNFAN